jgi:hypothetical protein
MPKPLRNVNDMSQPVNLPLRNWFTADVAKHPKMRVALFLVTVVVMMGYVAGSNPPPYFCCDAEHYWNLGNSYFKSGSFSLYNFETTFRGYSLPLILGFLRFVAKAIHIEEFRLFHLFNAVITAAALIYVIPSLAKKIFSVDATVVGTALIVALFVLFWGGYLIYPLSDTWSFFLAASAALATILALESSSGGKRLFLGLIAGAAVGLCLNIRPIYALSLPVYILAIMLARGVVLNVKTLVLLPFIAGVFAALVPQAVLNAVQIGTANPLSHSGSLYVLQIFMGTAVQRHECAYFMDTAGVSLLARNGIEVLKPTPEGAFYFDVSIENRSILEYIGMVLRHPVDFAALYIRHIFNGFTVLRDNIYACNYRLYDTFLSLASLLLAGLAIGLVCVASKIISSAKYKWFVLASVVPLLVIVPTAIEGRFFFPAQMWFYMLLAFVGVRGSTLMLLRARLGPIAAVAILIFAIGLIQFAGVQSGKYAWLGLEGGRVKLQPAPQLITQ